ncbi:MAG: FAD-binding oxidoreductase [Streptosporangiaceae bacterium]|jgi:glycine/D-amino acid oxidase-like deaminating enzyme
MPSAGAARQRRCVVAGAGVLGVCLAARLAETGAEVTLLDQDQPGQAATRSSFAWLNSNDKAPRAYHDLNHAGIRAWEQLAGSLGDVAWYRPAGNFEWAASEPGRAELAARVSRLTEWEYPARLISAAEAAELEPSLRLPRPAPEVAWFPGEGYLLTEAMVSDLLARAVGHGATVLTGERGRVTGFEARSEADGGAGDEAGWGVRTAAGQVIHADLVACCAGTQVPRLAALAGAACPVPLLPWAEPGATAPGLVVQAGPVTGPGLTRMVHAPEVYLRPHAGGLVHMEAPDAAVDLHTPDAELRRWAGELLDRARRVIHGLDDATVTGYRVCVRPMPADGQSIVGWLPGVEGVYVAVTHSGVTLGAHLAGLVADELLGGAAAAELAPFRPGRFIVG